MLKDKVIIGSLFHSFKDCNLHIYSHDYKIPNWFTMFNAITYENIEHYFVDNSQDVNYHKRIRAMGYNCDYIAPLDREPRFILAECFEKIRQYAITTNADGLVLIECDVYPPINCIELMLIKSKAFDMPVITL